MNLQDELKNLIFFRPKQDGILCLAVRAAETGDAEAGSSLLRRLAELAEENAFSGELWSAYAAFYFATNENIFTLSREWRSPREDSLSALARLDILRLRSIFSALSIILPSAVGTGWDIISDYRTFSTASSPPALAELRRALDLAQDADSYCSAVSEYYSRHGVGQLGLYSAFRLDETEKLIPAQPPVSLRLESIVGYESQKKALWENTAAFLSGKPANNVLLYGDAGSGKSTCIRALANELGDEGLRLIELHKHQMRKLPALISGLRRRGCKFILFMDDLSFEENETEYKYLKAVIEGGVEALPENLLIYATSNRRHLIRETWDDKSDMTHSGDIHRSDTVEEKLSLAGRFGLALNFSSPNRELYHRIVLRLAREGGITLDEAELYRLSDAWEIRHGGASGRAAKQFVDCLIGSGSI